MKFIKILISCMFILLLSLSTFSSDLSWEEKQQIQEDAEWCLDNPQACSDMVAGWDNYDVPEGFYDDEEEEREPCDQSIKPAWDQCVKNCDYDFDCEMDCESKYYAKYAESCPEEFYADDDEESQADYCMRICDYDAECFVDCQLGDLSGWNDDTNDEVISDDPAEGCISLCMGNSQCEAECRGMVDDSDYDDYEEEEEETVTSCKPGYVINDKAVGCEKIYCGANAEYNIKTDECICNEGYAIGSEGKCIDYEKAFRQMNTDQYEDFVKEQGITDEETQKKLVEKLIQYNLATSDKEREEIENEIEELRWNDRYQDDDEDALEKAKEEKRKEYTEEEKEVIADYSTYDSVSTLNEKNGKEKTIKLNKEKLKDLAKDVRSNMKYQDQQVVKKIENARGDQSATQEILTREELYKKFEKKGVTLDQTMKLIKGVSKQLGKEYDDDADFNMVSTIISNFMDFSNENGKLSDDKKAKLEQLMDGDVKGLVNDVIKEGLRKYADKNKHKLGKTVGKILDKIETLDQLGGMAKELGEKLGTVVEVYETLNEAGERIHAYRTKLGGPAGDAAVVIYVTKEGAKVLVDYTIGKIPIVGDVLSTEAAFILDMPNKIIDPLVQLNQNILNDYDNYGVDAGQDIRSNSEPSRFFDKYATQRLEKIGDGPLDNRRVATLKYKDPQNLDKIKTYDYNLNRISLISRTDEKGNKWYLPMENTDTSGKTVMGEVQFKRVDETYLMFFGCVKFEIYSTGNPPVKLGEKCI